MGGCVTHSTLVGLLVCLQCAASVVIALVVGPMASGLVAIAGAAWLVVECWLAAEDPAYACLSLYSPTAGIRI